MKTKLIKRVPYRRKRLGRTDYNKRLSLLISRRPRLVVRKSLKYVQAQIVTYAPAGDVVLATAHSKDLSKLGWTHSGNSTPAAYLVGILLAKNAKAQKVESAILDLGLQAQGSRLYAVVKGALDAGLNVPCGKEVFPSEDRITGKHLEVHAQKQNKTTTLTQDFKTVKQKLLAK